MAVGYRSSSVTGTSDAQDAGKNCPVPSGAAANDIALLGIEIWLNTSTDPIVTWPSGFTQKIFYESTTDGFQRLFVGWKRLTGADSGNYAYTISGSYWNMAHCILMTGAITTGDPIEITDTDQAAGTTSIPTNTFSTATIPGLVQFVANENAATQTPSTSFTEVQDGDYIHTSYQLPGASGTQTASGGSLSVSNAVILAALLAIIPDTAAVSDAGLWVPQNRGIILPQSALYFPFTTPWADVVTTGTTYQQSLAGTLTSAGALVIQPGKAITGSLTPAGVLVRQTQKTHAGTINPAGALLKLAAKILTGTASSAGALANSLVRLLSVAGSVASSGALAKQDNKPFSGGVTPTGLLGKQDQKSLAGSVASAGSVVNIKTILLALAGSIATAGSLVRRTGKPLTGSQSPVGGLVNHSAKRVTGGITPNGALTKTRLVLLSLAGAVTSAGAVLKRTGKALTGTASPSGLVLKAVSRILSGSITPTGVASHSTGVVPGTAHAATGSAPSASAAQAAAPRAEPGSMNTPTATGG